MQSPVTPRDSEAQTEDSEQAVKPDFEALVSSCFTVNADQQKRSVTDDRCIELLKLLAAKQPQFKYRCVSELQFVNIDNNPNALVNQLSAQLADTERLSEAQYASICFMESVFGLFAGAGVCHSEIFNRLQGLLPLMAAWQLQDKDWLWDQNNPLRQVLLLVPVASVGWQGDNGRGSQRYLDNLQQCLNQVLDQWLDAEQAVESVRAFVKDNQSRVQKLESRLCEGESGALRARFAHEQSIRIINDAMQGKLLPQCAITFLQGEWLEALRIQLAKDSDRSKHSKHMADLTEKLVWSFQPCDDDDGETKQGLYNLIPLLHGELAEACQDLIRTTENFESLLDAIDLEHLNIIKGQPVSYSEFTLLECEGALMSQAVRVESSLKKHMVLMRVQQWFVQEAEGQSRRMKLILKINDAKQLLFSNFSGQKTAQFSFEEFSCAIASQTLRPLSHDYSVVKAAEQVKEGLEARYWYLKQAKEKQRKALEAKERLRLELEQRQKLLREEARQKALAEAQRLEKLQREREQKEQQALQRAEQERREKLKEQEERGANELKQGYEEKVAQLVAGSVVDFTDELGEVSRCKLAVKMRSSDRYIFVDKNGIKACELNTEELVEHLLENSAKIISVGVQFEDTLARVVTTIRKKQ